MNGKYLLFALKKGTSDSFVWKATVRICCLQVRSSFSFCHGVLHARTLFCTIQMNSRTEQVRIPSYLHANAVPTVARSRNFSWLRSRTDTDHLAALPNALRRLSTSTKFRIQAAVAKRSLHQHRNLPCCPAPSPLQSCLISAYINVHLWWSHVPPRTFLCRSGCQLVSS